jgi:hypothetical protein
MIKKSRGISMSLNERLSKVEDKIDTHLKESGEVREAIKELHKAVDTISNRMWSAMGVSVLTLISMIGFLLKLTLWR